MKKTVLMAVFAALCLCAGAQEPERLDSVIVSASRAGTNTPVTHTDVGKEALRAANPMNSLPMTLNLLPSVVTYNEGGTGLGNSAMTIRGSKGSQVNVTLNGITLNDAESQEVFWVNIPALTALLSGVQVQRGLGTSANGTGAFGASVNMNTAFVAPDPSFRWELSAGSYGTVLTSVSGMSGLLPSGLYFSLAYSAGRTDGYIRNAGVESASLFSVLGWLKGRNSLRLTYLMGDQKSGMTWDGIDPAVYAVDRRYNGAGEYVDDSGKTRYYPNQTDNYVQHHVQLNYTRQLTDALTWSSVADYTRGDGYDEYYKTGRKFAEFGYPFSKWQDQKKSDMIYRKKESLSPEDLPFIVADVLKGDFSTGPDRIHIVNYSLQLTRGMRPVANLRIDIDGSEYEESAAGDGQYDAFMKALWKIYDRLGREHPRLTDYVVKTSTRWWRSPRP